MHFSLPGLLPGMTEREKMATLFLQTSRGSIPRMSDWSPGFPAGAADRPSHGMELGITLQVFYCSLKHHCGLLLKEPRTSLHLPSYHHR